MDILEIIGLAFALWFCNVSLVCILDSREVVKPPVAVRLACWIEIMLNLLAMTFMLFMIGIINEIIIVIVILLCLVWIVSSVGLYYRKHWARNICLGLSVLRIFTIVGIPLSLFSIYLLYHRKDSRDFFNDPLDVSAVENRGQSAI